MTIERLLNKVTDHFFQSCRTDREIIAVLERYNSFNQDVDVLKGRFFVGMLHASQLVRFVVWYYFTYMTPFHNGTYAVELEPAAIGSFSETRIRPVREHLLPDGKEIVTCDPDDAHYWVIEIQTAADKYAVVAEAMNQSAAQDTELFIHMIGKNYSKIC